MDFSDKLREVRKNFKWTQKDLAEMMGKSPATICDWEKGKSRPTIDELSQLASIFNVTTDYLLCRFMPYCPFKDFVNSWYKQRDTLRNVTLIKKFTHRNMALLEQMILYLEHEDNNKGLFAQIFQSVGYRFDNNEDEFRDWEFDNVELTEMRKLKEK